MLLSLVTINEVLVHHQMSQATRNKLVERKEMEEKRDSQSLAQQDRLNLLHLVLEAMILVMLVNPVFFIASGLGFFPFGSRPSILHLTIGINLAFLALLWLIISVNHNQFTKADIGLTRGYLATFLWTSLLLIFPILCIIWLAPMLVYTIATAGDVFTLISSFLFFVFFLSIYEEIMFRGYLLQRFRRLLLEHLENADEIAAFLSGLLYGLWKIPIGIVLLFGIPPHPLFAAILTVNVIIMAGFILGLLRTTTYSILPGISLHATANFLYSLIPILAPFLYPI